MNNKYNFHRPPENKEEYEKWLEKLTEQTNQVRESDIIECICKDNWLIKDMFRCYFCGLWICPKCAQKHFGKRPDGKYTYKDYYNKNERKMLI